MNSPRNRKTTWVQPIRTAPEFRWYSSNELRGSMTNKNLFACIQKIQTGGQTSSDSNSPWVVRSSHFVGLSFTSFYSNFKCSTDLCQSKTPFVAMNYLVSWFVVFIEQRDLLQHSGCEHHFPAAFPMIRVVRKSGFTFRKVGGDELIRTDKSKQLSVWLLHVLRWPSPTVRSIVNSFLLMIKHIWQPRIGVSAARPLLVSYAWLSSAARDPSSRFEREWNT